MPRNPIVTLIAATCCLSMSAQAASTGLEEEVNIYGRIYDAPLHATGFPQRTLSELYQKKPLLIGLVFTRCTGVCSPFLMQLKENLQLAAENQSVDVLIVSFDPRDKVEDMDLLARRLGLEGNKQWTFAVTDRIDKLNQSIGFDPVWDDLRSQFDHDALLVGINRGGNITKKLLGIRQADDLNLIIASVNNVFSPTYRLPTKNNLFSCFNYDPKTGKNSIGFGFFFIALPAILTVLLLVSTSYLVRGRLQHLGKIEGIMD